MRRLDIVSFVIAAILCGSQIASAAPHSPLSLQSAAPSQKQSRTPAQRKIDSQLLYEITRLQGDAEPASAPSRRTTVKVDRKHRALVDVRADVTPELEKKMRSLKATIVSTSPEYRTIVAWMPLLSLERLAEDRRVSAISPLADPVMHR